MNIDIEGIAELMRRVAAAEILPRFRQLKAGDTREKGPGDFVTVADEAAEAALTPQLLAALPGSLVVGEEATARDPSLTDALSGTAPVWVVDPIDGTGNFAGGSEDFVSMLALIQADRVLASWIYHPVSDRMAMTERGAGVSIGGRTAKPFSAMPFSTGQLSAGADRPEPRGILAFGSRGTPEINRLIEKRRGRLTQVKSRRAAGIDYVRMAEGEIDFAFFSGVMPWDHAPGAGIIEELGGRIGYIRNGRYLPSAAGSAAGILAARSAEIWQDIHRKLFEGD